jgi:hypothetical protein
MGKEVVVKYRVLVINIFMRINSIKILIDREIQIPDREVHYGHVGNLSHIDELLTEIENFLKNL